MEYNGLRLSAVLDKNENGFCMVGRLPNLELNEKYKLI
jgi:hypothetical protein